MSHYNRQEFDFIERTKKILEQYENLRIDAKEKFEVTLLINCLVGLLVLPQQNWFENLPSESININDWGISEQQITLIKENENSVKNVATHLRNSLTHGKFKVFKNVGNEINKIEFKDFDYKNNPTFNATLSVNDLRTFTENFSSKMIELMKTQK